MRKAVTIEAQAELFALRLSQTLKRKVEMLPLEQADAETIFLLTREDAIGGTYKKILDGKPQDSFLIRYPVEVRGKKNVCLLMTRDSWGYPYPCSYFLRKYLGVDIAGLGELGLILPDNSSWQMPAKINVAEFPDFATRRWTMNRVVSKEIQRMYLAESGRNITWHALGHIIHPGKYWKQHPEYFPLINGKRYKPRRALYDWAPCLSNPDVQKLCVEQLLKENHSDGAEGASLAVNDGAGHNCSCPGCLALDDPGERAEDCYSTRFFRFYGQVLNQAEKIRPGTKALILLYSNATTRPPKGTAIHPGLIGMGVNDKYFAEFHKLGMKRLGKWEHQLDHRYPTIRHYPHYMKKNLRRLHDIGVTEYFGEVYMIHAANGPKQYILGRLLWDLDTDVDAVMMEFCTKAYGQAAAPEVKAYYDVWEKIHDREIEAGVELQPTGLFSYGVEKYLGMRPEDVIVMEQHLQKAAQSSMTETQRKRLEIVQTYYDYISCLFKRYFLGKMLREKELSIGEISRLAKEGEILDRKFETMWKEIVSKDEIGNYRRVGSKKNDTLFYIYREAVTAYLFESIGVALANAEKKLCSGMKRSERLKFWQQQGEKYPDLLQISERLGANSGRKLPNLLRNGNFKEYRPGDPAIPGKHPILPHWFFYEEIGEVQSENYRSLWKLVPSKAGANHLCFGAGIYPEIRQFLFLEKGVYRFSLRFRGVSMMHFAFYQVPGFEEKMLENPMLARSKPFRKPAIYTFNYAPRPGEHPISRTLVIPENNWYVLLIAVPHQPAGSWNRIWNLKLEKMQ